MTATAPKISLTDVVVDAARATSSIYSGFTAQHAAKGRVGLMLSEAKRAALMEALAADENLCEMLSGRISQISMGLSIGDAHD